MRPEQKIIREAIENSLRKSGDYTTNQVNDIAFHMTDWLENFIELRNFFENPAEMPAKNVEKILLGFLVHVPDHLNAATKLMTGQSVEDVFNLGVTNNKD